MANFGLSHPWIARYDEVTGKYEDGFRCGKAVNTSVTPNYNEGSFFADNKEQEHVKEFKNATVALGIDRMPIAASTVVFGHTVDAEGEELDNADDSSNYVGYGFITQELVDGKKKFRACILLKVLFAEGEEGYETKGDSITFKNPTVSGTALALDNGDWGNKSPYFDTEQKADEWIQEKLNVIAVERCAAPTASVAGGRYTEAQSVILTTETAGAKIVYTTDGTTPGEDNGTEYENPIIIESNTGLRAYAHKDGMEPSDMTVEEYFITAEYSS